MTRYESEVRLLTLAAAVTLYLIPIPVWGTQVAGTSGKIQTDTTHDDDEGISTEAHGAAIMEALGLERRNEVRSADVAPSEFETKSACLLWDG